MKIWVAAALSLGLSGCVTAPPPTPEQVEMQRRVMEAFTQRIAQGGAPLGQPAANTVAPAATPAITESVLQAQIDQLPPSVSGEWVRFEPAPDGFRYNDQLFLAPEGRVTAFSANEKTGDVVYVVRETPQQFMVRLARPATGHGSVLIGSILGSSGNWRFSSVTGVTLGGSRFFPTPQGLAMVRERSGFFYRAGQGQTPFGVPEGFHIAAFQRGDVANTRHILLERDAEVQNDLAKSASDLAHMFGVSKKFDYALLNVDTNKMLEVPISLGDKETVILDNCRKKNAFFSECATSESISSFWNQDGSRNAGHPYWRMTWLQTRTAPVMIVKEGTLGSTVAVTDLSTGQRVVAFERTLGVNDFSPIRNPDGSVTLQAKLGFSSDAIQDLDRFMATGQR